MVLFFPEEVSPKARNVPVVIDSLSTEPIDVGEWSTAIHAHCHFHPQQFSEKEHLRSSLGGASLSPLRRGERQCLGGWRHWHYGKQSVETAISY
jgi:hypothetical protein